MVEVDELVGVRAFVDRVVGAEGVDVVRGLVEIIDSRVGWEGGVAALWYEGYPPESGDRVSPSAKYDFAVVYDLASCAVKEYFAACIH